MPERTREKASKRRKLVRRSAYRRKYFEPGCNGVDVRKYCEHRADGSVDVKLRVKCLDCNQQVDFYYVATDKEMYGDAVEIGGVLATKRIWKKILNEIFSEIKVKPVSSSKLKVQEVGSKK